jgi:hypothetical protein
MPPVTEGAYQGDLIRFEEDNRFSRKEITVKSGADLAVGTVLAVYTATADLGKYAAHVNGGTNGLQTAVAVLITDAKAASADAKAVALVRHAKVNRHALVFHSSVDDATKRGAAVTALAAAGIIAD